MHAHCTLQQLPQRIQITFNPIIRWKEVQSKTDVRDKQLREAYSWFKFQERVDELEEWIREKAALMPEDLGRDVTSVESLLRQHEAFKSEITPIDGEVNDLVSGGSSSGSSGNGPDDVHGRLLSQLESDLKSLKEKSAERQAKIAAALEFQVFVRDYQTADSWLTGLRGDIAASELHDDLTGAEVALDGGGTYKGQWRANERQGRGVRWFLLGFTRRRELGILSCIL